jgi:hypothetical protein
MLRVRFRLRYRRQAIVALLLGTLVFPAVTLITRSLSPATAALQTAPSSILGARHFYLTRTLHTPVQAPTACAEGYHFASIWEIADPSSLRYNTALGLTSSDSGTGPPTAKKVDTSILIAQGWVRTGYDAFSSRTPGQANCNAWGTNSELARGTVANLPSNWTGGDQDIGVWNTEVQPCDSPNWVWCVQDDSVWRVYLPVVPR